MKERKEKGKKKEKREGKREKEKRQTEKENFVSNKTASPSKQI